MGKGRAPTSLENYLIKKEDHTNSNYYFYSLGRTHQERVENYVRLLDEQIEREIHGSRKG